MPFVGTESGTNYWKMVVLWGSSWRTGWCLTTLVTCPGGLTTTCTPELDHGVLAGGMALVSLEMTAGLGLRVQRDACVFSGYMHASVRGTTLPQLSGSFFWACTQVQGWGHVHRDMTPSTSCIY